MSESSGQLARRTHWATPLVTFDLGLRQFALGLIPIISNRWWFLLVPLALGVLALRTALWWRRTYELGDHIVVRSGVITRSEEAIAAARIQEIAIERKVRHRLLGLTMVKISAAGLSTIVLNSVTSTEARRIEAVLLEARNRARLGPSPTGPLAHRATGDGEGLTTSVDGTQSSLNAGHVDLRPPPLPATTLFRVDTRDLVLGGLTSSALLAAPFVLVAGASQLDELGLASRAEDAVSGLSNTSAVILGVLASLVIAPLFGVVRMVVANHGLTVAHGGDEVVISRGALGTGSTTIPLSRLVRVQHRAGILRRALGLCAIEVSTATGTVLDINQASPARGRGSDIPVLRDVDAKRLLTVLLRGEVPQANTRHPEAARRRAIKRGFICIVLPVAVVAVGVGIAGFPLLLPVPVVVAFGVQAWSHRWFANLAHGCHPGLVVGREGWLLSTRTTYCYVPTTQSVAAGQSPFQRKHELCSVNFHGGRGGHTITDVSGDQAQAIVATFRSSLHVTSRNHAIDAMSPTA